MDEDQELIRGINSLRTEIELGQAFGKLPSFALGLFLFKRVDQFDGREEADFATMMFDRLHAKGHAKGVLPAQRRHGFCPFQGLPLSCIAAQYPAGQRISTAFCAPSMNSQRCSARTVASLISLKAKSKPERSL